MLATSRIPLSAGALLLTTVLGFGCTTSNLTQEQVLKTAADDLGCTVVDVEIVDDKPFQKVVEGCGSRLVYVKSCGGGASGKCQWKVVEHERL